MKILLAAAAVGSLALAGSASAATIFTDDFVNAAYGANVTPAGWTTTDGTVEGLGPAFFGGLCTSGGSADQYCVDLDGSTNDAGVMTRAFSLQGGTTYIASFDLAGSQRGDLNSITVTFGGASATYSLASADAFSTRTLSFTPTTNGAYSLSFANAGGDNVGVLLDRVSIAAGGVPEPATWAVMLLGFFGLGSTLRVRRAQRALA